MSQLLNALKTIRPPTSVFINEDSFPDAIATCPALSSVAATGLRDKDFDEGFMSAMSAIFDVISEKDKEILAALTLDIVIAIDHAMVNDPEFTKTLLNDLPSLARYLKTKAKQEFKAGVLLAIASAAYGDEIEMPEDPINSVQDDDDDGDTPRDLTRADPIDESRIMDERENAPASETRDLKNAPTHPISSLLLKIKELFATDAITMEPVWDENPHIDLNVEMGQMVAFDTLALAMVKLREIGVTETYVSSSKDGIVIRFTI